MAAILWEWEKEEQTACFSAREEVNAIGLHLSFYAWKSNCQKTKEEDGAVSFFYLKTFNLHCLESRPRNIQPSHPQPIFSPPTEVLFLTCSSS